MYENITAKCFFLCFSDILADMDERHSTKPKKSSKTEQSLRNNNIPGVGSVADVAPEIYRTCPWGLDVLMD